MSSRVVITKFNNNNFENRTLLCAACVFHQLLCVSIVQFKPICKKLGDAIGCYRANLDFNCDEIGCDFECFVHSVMTNWACAAASSSFVRYLYSLVAIVSNICVFNHGALVCLVEYYMFLFPTLIKLYFHLHSPYDKFINFSLLKSIHHDYLNLAINGAIVKSNYA